MSVCLPCEILPNIRDRKLQSSSVLVLGRRGATGLKDAEMLFACECDCFEPSRGSMGIVLLQYKRKIWQFFKTGSAKRTSGFDLDLSYIEVIIVA